MIRALLHIILILSILSSLNAQTTPVTMRLDYMLKQVNDERTEADIRIAWADSIIAGRHLVDDTSIVGDVLMKKAEITYKHGLYRKSLESYVKWINDYGTEASEEKRFQVLDKVAELYYYMGWYELSMQLSLEVLKTEKPETLHYFDCQAYQRMAHGYIRLRDMKYAQKYTHLADSCLAAIKVTDTALGDKIKFDMSILKAAVSMIDSDYRLTYTHLADARKFARSVKDTIAILGDEAIIYEAIGDVNISRQCYESIMAFHDKSYQSMVCINNYIYFLTGQRDFAKAHEICALSYRLLEEMELDHSKSNLLGLESDIYMFEGDYHNAYTSLRKSIEIKDTIFTSEHLGYIYGAANLADKHNLSVRLAAESKRSSILGIAGIVLLILAATAIVMWTINSLKVKKLVKEKEDVEASLKNELGKKEAAISELSTQIDRKNREIESYVITLGDDEVIKNNFNNLHRKLSVSLLISHPDLTKAEINMAAFILLGLPTKDIADRLRLSVRTIENTKYRLYKKIGVNAAEVPDYLRRFI